MQLLSHTWHGNAARLKSQDFWAHVFTGREARVKCCEAVSACVSMSQHGSTCKWPGRCMASKAAAAMGVGGRCCRGLEDNISCSTSSQLLNRLVKHWPEVDLEKGAEDSCFFFLVFVCFLVWGTCPFYLLHVGAKICNLLNFGAKSSHLHCPSIFLWF